MTTTALKLPAGAAICYSGYRHGQSPDARQYPSVAQIREDLHLLAPHWQLLRLYDCSPHAERVLQVIQEDRLPFKVLLGAYLGAEASNPGCPWGAQFTAAQLQANCAENEAELERLIALARSHEDVVFAVAVGNEATVDWTDHLVPVARMVAHVRRVKAALRQPVTFCENYVPWAQKLAPLVAELDFIAVHTYPLWEYQRVEDALAYTQANLNRVAHAFPGVPLVITEAGWATRSNGRGMHAHDANQAHQVRYLEALLPWAAAQGMLCFVFEAFDEPWKGSPDPLEPEKHWGLYTVEREPKLAALSLVAMARAGKAAA
jgi:exo-beta-1,3-glucanase (GH17 family)